MRESVYAKQIANGRMTKVKADKQIGDMVAVRTTLAWVRDNRAAIVVALHDREQGQ